MRPRRTSFPRGTVRRYDQVAQADWLLNNKTAAANTDIHLELADRTAAGKDLQERSSRDQLSADRGIDKQQTCFEALC